jgi:hypothetical protein
VGLLAQHLTVELDDHHLSAVLERLFNAFIATSIAGGRFLDPHAGDASRHGECHLIP